MFQHRSDSGHLITEFKGGKGAAASWLNPHHHKKYVTAISLRPGYQSAGS